MKKLTAAFLVMVMALALFAGCGSKKGNLVHINIYRTCFNLADPDSEQVTKVEAAINEYIKDKINVEISLFDIPADAYRDSVLEAKENGDINLLWTASWEGEIGTNRLAAQGEVYDITDLLKDSTLYNSMDEVQWQATKYNGHNYFIPVYKDNVEGYDFMFRKDLADKYNWDIDKVKKLSDLETLGILGDCKKEGLKYPYLTQRTAMFYRWYIDSFDFFTTDSYSNFFAIDRKKNEVVDTILTDEYREFCMLMANWVEKGYISPDDYNKETTENTTQTKDWGVSWWTDVPINEEASARYKQDVVFAIATDRWAHSTSALGSCYCIMANSTEAQAKACIDFTGLLYTDSHLADLYTFGIEGEDFEYDSNGQIVQHSDKYNHSMWESASATIVTPISGEPLKKADLYIAFNGSANTSCAAGFCFDSKPVQNEYENCRELFSDYGYLLENGAFKPGEVDAKLEEYQKALDAAGYQKVLAEFQAQYNSWKSK